jgi:hypothetical protein
MPVDTQHAEYAANVDRWRKYRDAVEGEDAIKREPEKYLPRLPGMAEDHEGELDYQNYLCRAMYYGASGRTVTALVGAVFRRPAQTNLPEIERAKELTEKITPEGESLENFARRIVDEDITIGRYGIRVDFPEEGAELAEGERPRAYLCGYRAEAMINWRTEMRGGRRVPTLIVLEYEHEEPDPKDEFVLLKEKRWEVLFLDSARQYTVQRFKKVRDVATQTDKFEPDGPPIVPKVRGKALNFIPFVIVGTTSVCFDVEKSPIADLVAVNLKHYMEAADLARGRHYTACPTPWVAGYDDDDEDMRIGSGVAWTFRRTDTKVGMLEFTGAGLSSLSDGLAEKENLMALLGAAVLAPQKREAETAEALKIRNAGESSSLGILAGAVSEGLTQALKWLFEWEGISFEDVSVRLNRDFFESKMTPEELTAYMGAWQQGVLTTEALAHLLVQGELLPPGTKAEEYAEKLELEKPRLLGAAMTLEPGQPGAPGQNPPQGAANGAQGAAKPPGQGKGTPPPANAPKGKPGARATR